MLQGEMLMTGSGPAMLSQNALAASAPDSSEIDSRFGKVTIYPRQPITFTNGMLGMPDKLRYCLTRFPSPKMARFKLLQSLDDMALSFITLPIEVNNPLVDAADIQQAARDLDIPMVELALLLVVSVHRETGVARLSVNARAPIFMHAQKRTAAQYVFPNGKYQIRQPLSF